MASLRSITPERFLRLSKPNPTPKNPSFSRLQVSKLFRKSHIFSSNNRKGLQARSAAEELDVTPLQSVDAMDQQEGVTANGVEREVVLAPQVAGFATTEGQFLFDGFSSSVGDAERRKREEMDKLIDRTINVAIVVAAGTFVIAKLLIIGRHYRHGWTLYEILRHAPQHYWAVYEKALKTNPVLAKMAISGVVYSLGDWIAQWLEGKALLDFDRGRVFRSGLIGFALHGSLSHYYYQFCEDLFPFKTWWVVPAKVALDQTIWSAIWNSIYYGVCGFLRLDSPMTIYNELKATFWPTLTAGWKLWPFAHLITYGVVPVEQRLLWVDSIELIWVTILSTFSNDKSEVRKSQETAEAHSNSSSAGSS